MECQAPEVNCKPCIPYVRFLTRLLSPDRIDIEEEFHRYMSPRLKEVVKLAVRKQSYYSLSKTGGSLTEQMKLDVINGDAVFTSGRYNTMMYYASKDIRTVQNIHTCKYN